MPVENPYIYLGQLITFFYFLYFILVVFFGFIENFSSNGIIAMGYFGTTNKKNRNKNNLIVFISILFLLV